MDEIDNIYTRFKMNARRCEAELHKLKDQVLTEFKEGVIDEKNYDILDKRIDDYMKEIREEIVREKLGDLHRRLDEELQNIIDRGEINKEAFEALGRLIDEATDLKETEKAEPRALLEKWKKEYLKE